MPPKPESCKPPSPSVSTTLSQQACKAPPPAKIPCNRCGKRVTVQLSQDQITVATAQAKAGGDVAALRDHYDRDHRLCRVPLKCDVCGKEVRAEVPQDERFSVVERARKTPLEIKELREHYNRMHIVSNQV